MALCSYDEAYTIPTEHSALISLRTMQILVEEMGLCDTVDPLGGSFYVETLTNEMRARIREVMNEVDRAGGIVSQIEQGAIQAAVSACAYRSHRELESGQRRKVGVNCYRIEAEEPRVDLHLHDEQKALEQIERLRQVRRERDQRQVDQALAAVDEAARSGTNLMPAVLEAVRAYASVGEITRRLVEVFGRYREPILF